MSGSTLRRTVLCLVAVSLLLPLASAWAVPVQAKETVRIQLPAWSRIMLASFPGLLELLRPLAEASSMPPGQKPGNDDPSPTQGNRDGSGLDPHGKP